MAENFSSSLPQTLPKMTPHINLELGRFFISVEEFHLRVQKISCETEKIKSFSTFAINNFKRVQHRRLVYGDMEVFVEFLSNFIDKAFIDTKKLFETTCGKYQFDFLLLHDLSRG